MSPFWSLLELRIMEEVVVITGATTRAKLQSNRHHQETNTQISTGRMPVLSPNQECQSTDGKEQIESSCMTLCAEADLQHRADEEAEQRCRECYQCRDRQPTMTMSVERRYEPGCHRSSRVAVHSTQIPHAYYAPAFRVGALSDDAHLTSVCRVHRP